jgi:hypothetical protein
MTGPQYPENSAADDEAWLDALAGRPAPSLSAQDRAEVEHLRQAWANRKARLEEHLPEVDDDFVNRLLERRAREAEKNTSASQHSQGTWFEPIPPVSELSAGPVSESRQVAANGSRYLWGIAASFLAITVLLVTRGPVDDEENVQFRSGLIGDSKSWRTVSENIQRRVSIASSHVIIEVVDREQEYNELASKALALQANIKVARRANGDFEITVPPMLAGTEFLYRITPVLPERGGVIVVLITSRIQ